LHTISVHAGSVPAVRSGFETNARRVPAATVTGTRRDARAARSSRDGPMSAS
jgi:hypothetical protein